MGYPENRLLHEAKSRNQEQFPRHYPLHTLDYNRVESYSFAVQCSYVLSGSTEYQSDGMDNPHSGESKTEVRPTLDINPDRTSYNPHLLVRKDDASK